MIPVLAGPGLEAAEQLLVRAGCLRPEHSWAAGAATEAAPRIDFAVLAEQACLLDLSEEAVARIAVSLATGRPVDLRSAFGHLTRDHARLVMTAVAAAAGHDRVSSRIRVVGDERRVETAPPLAVWPS
ncbi:MULTISPECIES: hypothetical protein [unclassified Rathayibacter]|uniref:hypothetical protein n=1 Tax=unclassified Rathayibacter TaxID=2609250 RepID=UPI000CE73BCF|nr:MULTISPECIES: hypothetical protein [unclassified Rathayibacter]PPF19828.1 hypothetical protein C5B92_02255 [Rathayibacter sp. AY1A4]PPG82594.1 hypothetical protein C5C52_05395 [Rathayibacter sp. AY1E5]PPH32509.1 hypothetical protein C5C94_06100 [Rathayibacter sp. AY1C3]PPH64987.1 hypothetical protein C5D25_04940 [Rathayibacter sp. AY1D7]PPI32218.1 hypothetical protein C5D66_05820 [Rathayibacter sp. AY1B4]